MENRIRVLIEKYKSRCEEIEEQWCSIDENGEPVFDYECDYDDQLMTTEAESEYYTLLNVIEELEELLRYEVNK